MSLEDYGWNETWEAEFAALDQDGSHPARVVAEHRGRFRVRTLENEREATIAGRMRHEASGPADLPAVGDWVAVGEDDGGSVVIRQILPRRTRFSRKTAGARTDEQVVAANIDTVWVVTAFGPNFNRNRIDRYVALVWESGAEPRVILSKADLDDAPDLAVAELESTLVGVPVHAVSAVDGSGLDTLSPLLVPGHTIALLGSSGVGKSTLVNRLAGTEIMGTTGIRADGKGRHKTTHRQLVLLPDGGLLLDTPGMREIQLWNADAGMEKGFADIEALAPGCRYADCSHTSEPGCAVKEAVDSGGLDRARLESFHKLRKELDHLERKQDALAAKKEKRRWGSIMRDYRRNFKKDR